MREFNIMMIVAIMLGSMLLGFLFCILADPIFDAAKCEKMFSGQSFEIEKCIYRLHTGKEP